jgi:hypothetical protein
LQRGLHDIEDELIIPNLEGYAFHDSRGFEAGRMEEEEIAQNFIRRKSRERQLKDRLHAIWFVLQDSYSSKFNRFAFQVLRTDGQLSARARNEAS